MTNSKLSKNEMKKVLGGTGSTSCSTTCKDGSTVSITGCIGTCMAEDKQYVTCSGTNNSLTKYCPGVKEKYS